MQLKVQEIYSYLDQNMVRGKEDCTAYEKCDFGGFSLVKLLTNSHEQSNQGCHRCDVMASNQI